MNLCETRMSQSLKDVMMLEKRELMSKVFVSYLTKELRGYSDSFDI